MKDMNNNSTNMAVKNFVPKVYNESQFNGVPQPQNGTISQGVHAKYNTNDYIFPDDIKAPVAKRIPFEDVPHGFSSENPYQIGNARPIPEDTHVEWYKTFITSFRRAWMQFDTTYERNFQRFSNNHDLWNQNRELFEKVTPFNQQFHEDTMYRYDLTDTFGINFHLKNIVDDFVFNQMTYAFNGYKHRDIMAHYLTDNSGRVLQEISATNFFTHAFEQAFVVLKEEYMEFSGSFFNFHNYLANAFDIGLHNIWFIPCNSIALGLYFIVWALCISFILNRTKYGFTSHTSNIIYIYTLILFVMSFMIEVYYTLINSRYYIFNEWLDGIRGIIFGYIEFGGAVLIIILLTYADRFATGIQGKQERIEFPFFMVVFYLIGYLAVTTKNFFVIFLALEIISFMTYSFLASYDKDFKIASSAALRYLFYSSLPAALFAFGIIQIFLWSGAMTEVDLATLSHSIVINPWTQAYEDLYKEYEMRILVHEIPMSKFIDSSSDNSQEYFSSKGEVYPRQRTIFFPAESQLSNDIILSDHGIGYLTCRMKIAPYAGFHIDSILKQIRDYDNFKEVFNLPEIDKLNKFKNLSNLLDNPLTIAQLKECFYTDKHDKMHGMDIRMHFYPNYKKPTGSVDTIKAAEVNVGRFLEYNPANPTHQTAPTREQILNWQRIGKRELDWIASRYWDKYESIYFQVKADRMVYEAEALKDKFNLLVKNNKIPVVEGMVPYAEFCAAQRGFNNTFDYLTKVNPESPALIATSIDTNPDLSLSRLHEIGVANYNQGTAFLVRDHSLFKQRVVPFIFLVGVFLINLTFYFKLHMPPVHSWALSIYNKAPLATVLILFVFMKIVLICTFLTLKFKLAMLNSEIFSIMSICVALSGITYAAIRNMSEKYFREFLIFSSISHTGFMLLGLSIQDPILSKNLVFEYLMVYVISNIILWLVVITYQEHRPITLLSEFARFAYRERVRSVVFGVTILSMAGLPPLGGFFVKANILLGLIACNYFYTSLFALLLTVVSFFYYLRLIKICFFEEENMENVLRDKHISPNAERYTNISNILVFICFMILLGYTYFGCSHFIDLIRVIKN